MSQDSTPQTRSLDRSEPDYASGSGESAAEPQSNGATVAGPASAPLSLSQTTVGFIASLLIYLVGAIVLAAVVAAVAGTGFISKHTLEFDLLAYQFLAIGVFGVALLLVSARSSAAPATSWASLGFWFPGWQTLLSAAAMVPVIFVAVALFSIIFNVLVPGYHLEGNSHELVPNGERVGAWTQIVVLVWAAVEVPLVEETLFRGILYQGLRRFFTRWLPGPGAVFAAALLSGLVFGAVHFQVHTLPILAFLGLALAYIFQVTRSIYASALVHGAVNAVAVIVVFHNG